MSDKPHQKRVGSIALTIPPPRSGTPEWQREIRKAVYLIHLDMLVLGLDKMTGEVARAAAKRG